VARVEGRVVFVRHALPGERVRARVTEGRERDPFLRADAVEVLEASPDRVTPPCPFSGPGRCGGCDWQHAALPAQRDLKAAVVAEQLRRGAGVDLPVVVEEVPGAPDGLGWRTRVRWTVDDGGRAGLLRYRSHEVEPVEACAIAQPGVTGMDVPGRAWPAVASVLTVASAGSGDRALVATPRRRRGRVEFPELPEDVSLVRDDGRAGVVVQGAAAVHEVALGRSFAVSHGGFWQVHPGAADVLSDAVLDGLDPQPGETVLDLYAGVGLFAAGLAVRVGAAGRVVAVESHRGAASDARRNLRGLPVRVVRGRADHVLAGRVARGVDLPDRADLVVLDPPRSGAGRAVTEHLTRLAPRRVAYVACDPAALARDVATFRVLGYRLASLRAFDLFPMTHHVECVALLEPEDDRHRD